VIEAVDQELAFWVRSILGAEVAVSFLPPGQSPQDQPRSAPGDESGSSSGVSLYLLDLLSASPIASPTRGGRRPPLQLQVRYLVSTWAAEPEEAHRLLGEIAFAALAEGEATVELDGPSPGLWLALGTSPRPAFFLRRPVRRERPAPAVARVREPMTLAVEPVLTLTGQVLGPGSLPISGARVELPHLGKAATADHQGRFRFTAVPAGAQTLRIHAKGLTFDATAQAGGEPSVVRLEIPFEQPAMEE